MSKITAYGICLYKKEIDSIEILLCKSVNSQNRWGFLKGVSLENESKEETALREFTEESNIKVNNILLEEFFYQKNDLKDIGIYLVNYTNVENVDSYFDNEDLKEENICKENSEVKFFPLEELPLIKKKQVHLCKEVIDFLKS